MSTTTTAANGTARQVKAISRRAASQGKDLKSAATREARALTERAGQMLATATRTTREHPWAATGVLAIGAALIGGYLWARNNR
jgi:ElaB/YqjD/DUF883 family membrane-anchored ribosome-binding protein